MGEHTTSKIESELEVQMEIIKVEKKLCLCCMEEHEVQTVRINEINEFKGVTVEYVAVYDYCDRAGEYFSTEEMISENDVSMKNAYRNSSA